MVKCKNLHLDPRSERIATRFKFGQAICSVCPRYRGDNLSLRGRMPREDAYKTKDRRVARLSKYQMAYIVD